MAYKLLCVAVAVASIAVVSSKKSCWGHKLIPEVKELFPYCKDIITTNSMFEIEGLNIDTKDSSEILCQNIRKWLDESNSDVGKISQFNVCMSQSNDGLEFYQMKKVFECLRILNNPVFEKNAKEIVYDHIADRRIFRSVMNYLNQEKTEENQKSVNDFLGCINFQPDSVFNRHN
ncbi:uncharacterized protein [Diabrotica undecimpunctata]|uniref:uncharacterized protein n=1 Tax=Diabrotica undecimpunctata TaxID=50387 RepID=UPI003B63F466